MGVTAPDLLTALRARGVSLETDGRRLRWRPAQLVDPDTATLIVALKAELIPLVAPQWCGQCGGRVDAKRRCWKCCDRPCVVCGKPTNSAFIQSCFSCGHLLPDDPPYQPN